MAAANSNSLNINVDRSKNEALNLQVLQRRDSNVMEIVSTASHVVVYAFDHDNKEWVNNVLGYNLSTNCL